MSRPPYVAVALHVLLHTETRMAYFAQRFVRRVLTYGEWTRLRRSDTARFFAHLLLRSTLPPHRSSLGTHRRIRLDTPPPPSPPPPASSFHPPPFLHRIALRPNGSSSTIHRSTCIDGCLVDASQGNWYTKSVESWSAAVRDATSSSAVCDEADSSSDPSGASFPRAMTQPPTKCTGQCIRSVTTALLARARRVLGPMYGNCACAARRVR